MGTMHFDELSRISIGGVDLTGHVTEMRIDTVPEFAELPTVSMEFSGLWEPISIEFSGKIAPRVFYALFEPWRLRRIRRMHTAYHRRRGNGKW